MITLPPTPKQAFLLLGLYFIHVGAPPYIYYPLEILCFLFSAVTKMCCMALILAKSTHICTFFRPITGSGIATSTRNHVTYRQAETLPHCTLSLIGSIFNAIFKCNLRCRLDALSILITLSLNTFHYGTQCLEKSVVWQGRRRPSVQQNTEFCV